MRLLIVRVAQVVAALLAVPLGAAVLAGNPPPPGIHLIGIIVGSLYGLVGIGIILVFQGARIINFAGAQLGSAAATFALVLMAKRGLGYGPALALAIGGGLLIGAIVDLAVIRRFRSAPRLVLTVATIGLAQVLAFAEFWIPKVVSGDAFLPNDFPTPFDSLSFRVGVVTFSGDHVVAVVGAFAVLAGLTAFLRFSDVGIAIRAAAENADRAASLGIPVRRVSTAVWAIAAALSAVGVFLRAPLVGLPVGGFTGPGLLLFGLAAAVVARMRNMTTCVVAGICIGMLEQATVFSTRASSLSYGLMLLVVLGALGLQRRDIARAFDAGASTYEAIATVRSIPSHLRGLREVRVARHVVTVAGAAIALALPLLLGRDQRGLLTLVVITAIVGVSLVVLTGWAGQISLGQFAIAGVGAAVAGGLAARQELDLFVTIGAAALAAAAAAVVIGLPALRLQGLLLAVTTLAFAFTVQFIGLNPDYTGDLLPGPGAFIERPRLYGLIDLRSDIAFYYLTLAFFVLCVASALALRRCRSGRAFIATRDNPGMAQAVGLSVARTRLAAFAISGAMAGIAGALLAYQQRSVDDLTFNPTASITMFAMTAVGGLGSVLGAVLGAVYVRGIPYLLEPHLEGVGILSTGVGLLVLLLALPGGLAEGVYRVRDRWLRRVARRHGLDTPGPDPVPARDVTSAAALDPPAVATREPALLRCRGVEVRYGQVQVLFGVDLDVRPGESLALLGTNGAGKSTLLRAVTGLSGCSSGAIAFEGDEISGRTPEAIAARGIVLVPGGKAIFPTLTVAEHFRCASWLHRRDGTRNADAVDEVLATFPRLRERWQQLAGDLSGGEQQMLALGMAFVARPRLLLIDELSLGLAPAVVEQLLVIVERMRDEGTAVVLVEQSLNVALSVCERAYFLEKGEVRFEGATAELVGRDDIARSVFLASASDVSSVLAPTAATASHDVPAPAPARALAVDGLAKRYGGLHAVSDVSFTVSPGETVGFIGPNGAGKTTLFDLLSGHTTADAGTVRLGGVDVTGWSPDRRSRAGLGRSMQDARLFPSLTVAENLALGLERHLPVRDHVAAALGAPEVARVEDDVAWSVADLVELMQLGPHRDKLLRELSTGTRRIVDLAMCVGHDPSVLLLDEPSSGIAQRETEALVPVLQSIRRETGCALLVIEHDIPLVREISDRLVAMILGTPAAVGDPSTVLADPDVVAAYLGTSDRALERSGTR